MCGGGLTGRPCPVAAEALGGGGQETGFHASARGVRWALPGRGGSSTAGARWGGAARCANTGRPLDPSAQLGGVWTRAHLAAPATAPGGVFVPPPEPGEGMTGRGAAWSPVCSRCGKPQPTTGPLRTSDGTPITVSTYLDLAGLSGDALVCPDCLPSLDALGRELSGLSPSGHTETPLDERECRRLLPTQPIGRLAFTEHALPVIRPAHFVFRGPRLVLAGLTDGRVASARRDSLVAFEVDAYDAARRQGWWVCAIGRCRLITDRSQIRELDDLQFTPWSKDPDRNDIAIDIAVLRGQRLAPTA